VSGDALHVATGPDFRIRVLEAGQLSEVYGVARPRRRVTQEAIETYTEFYTQAIADAEQRREYLSGLDDPGRPEELPAYDQIVVADDGNVWARLYWPDLLAPATWDVFAPSREWLGQVRTPEGFSLSAVAGGKLVGVWRDTLGVEYVRVYRLRAEEQGAADGVPNTPRGMLVTARSACSAPWRPGLGRRPSP